MRDLAARLQRLAYLRPALAVAVVVILVGDVYRLVENEATPVSVETAVERFREEGDAVPDPGSPPTVEAPTVPSPSAPPPPASTTTTRGPATPRPGPAVPPSGEAPRPASLLRPPPGVYRYVTAGSESLSLLGATRRYPAETTRTVRHGAGCSWSMRLALLAEHEEEHFVCSSSTVLNVTGNTTKVSWFGFSSTVNLVCDPPFREADRAAPPGTSTPFACRQGAESTFGGTTTIGAEEAVTVGGVARRAWRVLVNGVFEGQTRGTVTVTLLIDTEDGLVLFEQRTSDLTQRSPVGDVAYRQQVSLTLSSVSPST